MHEVCARSTISKRPSQTRTNYLTEFVSNAFTAFQNIAFNFQLGRMEIVRLKYHDKYIDGLKFELRRS